MLKRCYLLILLMFVLASCAHHKPQTPPAEVKKQGTSSTRQFRQVSSFNQIVVQGRLNVNLHTGYNKPEVMLRGDPRDLVQVRTVVKQNTLYVSLGQGYPDYGTVTVDIKTKFLNRFRYEGAGVVTGNNIRTSYLDLYLANEGTTRLAGNIGLQKLEAVGSGVTQINGVSSRNLQIVLKGDPKVLISGFVNLRQLDMYGKGTLSLYWIKSDTLTIRAKKAAKIQLAGIVNRLDVELWDFAQFKGKYLRAQRSFVKTHDKSVAEISAVNHQSSLATDASDIYYYNLSKTRADFMAFNGSVLDMRDWGQSDLKDFDRYNKQFP
ncbi:TPA: DUF2807 domain-containing protein [Legionella pneumophila]|nr:DUF2807 domain-containing protein [Legionella pneumophila]MCZ4700429.1 DUF2807 domain-containing protein [Legionella pneumophila]MCZ4730852.1 DUF2807 domain-containing protein [Legionella pneumophila]MCZ4752752.1 DUF2807 domain-containing protein [Legionella pneumophila]MDW9052372.1 DUF2807 domain-containing protein [Legionella pneumophila]MDW9061665.1 DUF2807 domain-containing protein [Legionella pneumophila]